MALGPLPKDAPDEALVRIANIVTGRYRTPEQRLSQDHVVVKQLEPYSKWLYSHLNFHQTDQLDAIHWFQETVTFFSDNPDGQIAKFLEIHRPKYPKEKGDKFMRDLVLSCLSYWLTIDILYKVLDNTEETKKAIENCVADLETVSERNKEPRAEEAIRAGQISVKELIYNGKLIPPAREYTDPLKSINAGALNVYKLVKFGRLKVKWTTDLSRHLEIVEKDRHLYLFCMPCIFDVQKAFSSTKAVQAFRVYIPEQYTEELRRSYWLLFSSSRRGRASFKQAIKGDREIRDISVADEQVLRELAIRYNKMDTVWDRDNFAHLWPRILELRSHLDSAQPEGWWGLIWHDKSQPYVFVPAIISGILFLLALASTGATIAQTWKVFQPAPPTPTGS